MPEPIAVLLGRSSLPAGGRVFSDALRLSVLPLHTVLRLQLGARSQKTASTLRVAGRPLPVQVNTWLGEDPVFLRIAPDTWLVESALHDASDLLPAVRTAGSMPASDPSLDLECRRCPQPTAIRRSP